MSRTNTNFRASTASKKFLTGRIDTKNGTFQVGNPSKRNETSKLILAHNKTIVKPHNNVKSLVETAYAAYKRDPNRKKSIVTKHAKEAALEARESRKEFMEMHGKMSKNQNKHVNIL